MKKFFLAVALSVVSAGAASAQGGRAALTPEQMQAQKQDTAERWRLYLFNGITLNDGQKSKASDIIMKWIDADAALNHDRTPDEPLVPAFRAKRAEIENKRNADLASVLVSTADKARFDKNAKTASSY